MTKPLVSIITPCYNGEAFLKRYFESILNQTYPNLELIFINDGSTDRTEEIALSYRERLEKRGITYIYEKQENAGQAAALNRGLKLFTGEYLTWPDSDDVMTKDSIEKKVHFLEKNPKYEMVRSNGVYFDETTHEKKKISDQTSDKKEDIFEDLVLLRTYGCCGCYMIRKSLLEKIYPKRDIFVSRYGQNWQILVPAASKSKCGYIDEELYIVFEHADSHSRSKRTAIQEMDRWDGFTEILLSAIDESDCDKEKCKRMVKENCARQQFYYAITMNDKAILKEKFYDIKRYGHASSKEYLLYIKHRWLK